MLTEEKNYICDLGQVTFVLWSQFLLQKTKGLSWAFPRGLSSSDNLGGPGCSQYGPAFSCGGHKVNLLLSVQQWVQGEVTLQQVTPLSYK